MVKISSSAVLAALVLGLTQASPVDQEKSGKVLSTNPIGYDPDVARKNGRLRPGPAPEVLSIDDLKLDETITQTEPLTVSDEELQKRYINGVDDRYLFTDTYLAPYRSVGKLTWSNGVYCSAALVGPKLILTAAHCIVSGATATFSPGYLNFAPFGTATVTSTLKGNLGTSGTGPCAVMNDWAVAILDKEIGNTVGYFGVKLAEKSKVDKPIFTNLGYPGDKSNGQQPYRTDGTRIQGFRNNWDCDAYGTFYTDSDTAGGQSGSPLWETVNNKPYIWGALSTAYTTGNNVAWAGWGAGQSMVSVINALNP